MNRKVAIVAIAFFLGVLFIATIGTSLTGYVVLDNSRISLSMYPFPFIKNNVYNNVYIVLPSKPTADDFSAALRIANQLRINQPLQPLYAKIVAEKTLPPGDHNLILIGDPCRNNLIAKELKTSSNDDCSMGLKEGEGLIQLVNHRRTSTLILGGDVIKASKVLTGDLYPLTGKKIIIKGKHILSLQYE